MSLTKDQSLYTDESIQVLEGLDAVRKRPGMYIGSTDARGLHHLVFEIMEKAEDKSYAGLDDKISVTVHSDESITIEDEGRGMPIGNHQSGKSTPEVILTVLHAGGKFGEGGYKTAGGLHGVGAAVVNGLSEKLTVTIKRDGKIMEQKFVDGGQTASSLTQIGTTKDTGTKIHFKPDTSIFTSTSFQYDILSERLREAAFLLKGIQIELTDEREGINDVFQYPDGLKSFIDYLNEEKDTLHSVVYFEGRDQEIEVDFAFQFNDGYADRKSTRLNSSHVAISYAV